jgi:hypothetical protein
LTIGQSGLTFKGGPVASAAAQVCSAAFDPYSIAVHVWLAFMGGKNNVHELVLLDQAGQALAEARSLDEIKTIRDKAEAVRKYAQSASLGLDVQNRAAEVKLRAERQAGKLLSQMMLRGGDRRSKSHHDRLKLDDLGLTANQSKRWQLQARVPEVVFREFVKQTREECRELTSAGVMRLAKRLIDEPSGRNGQAGSTTGYASNGRCLDEDGKISSRRNGSKCEDFSSNTAVGEIVAELRNHLTVLDGILSPLYSGDTSTLQSAERRMIRYLLTEIGDLFDELGSSEYATGIVNASNSKERAAI